MKLLLFHFKGIDEEKLKQNKKIKKTLLGPTIPPSQSQSMYHDDRIRHQESLTNHQDAQGILGIYYYYYYELHQVANKNHKIE